MTPAMFSLIFDRSWKFLHTLINQVKGKANIAYRNPNAVAICIKKRQNSLVLKLILKVRQHPTFNLGLLTAYTWMFGIELSTEKRMSCRIWICVCHNCSPLQQLSIQNFMALHFEIGNLKFHKFGNYLHGTQTRLEP